jgi:hypothetical protein
VLVVDLNSDNTISTLPLEEYQFIYDNGIFIGMSLRGMAERTTFSDSTPSMWALS